MGRACTLWTQTGARERVGEKEKLLHSTAGGRRLLYVSAYRSFPVSLPGCLTYDGLLRAGTSETGAKDDRSQTKEE